MIESLLVFKKYLKILLLYFLIFQISRLYFMIYNSDLLQTGFISSWIQSTYHGLRLDFSACAYCLTPLLLVWLAEEISGRKFIFLQKFLIIFSIVLIALITIADAELFRDWGSKFNSQVLVYITHPVEMALSAGAINWVKTILFTVILVLLCRQIYKIMLPVIQQAIIPKRLNTLLLLLFAGVNFIILRGGVGIATIGQSAAIYSVQSIDNASSVNSLWNSIYYIVTNSDNIYGDKLNYLSEQEASESFDRQLEEKKDSTALFNTQKPNIMIVMLESFSANASDFFTGKNQCTPHLDDIASQSLSFMKCYSSGDRTEKGLVSILSGYPAQPSSSIIVFPDKMNKLPSLSRSLKPIGYNNLFIYGGDSEFASMKAYLTVHQFDKIVDNKNFEAEELTSKWGAHDEHLYKRAIGELRNAKPPFLATIMSVSSHEPFDVPYKSTKIKKDEWYAFKNSIEYADQCLYQFLEDCKKENWYKHTVIVLVADHGHDIGLEDVHYFGPEKYHIPLIITGGALNTAYQGKKMDNYVSQTVIPSLLLGQLGLPTSAFKWQTGAFNTNGFAQYHFGNGIGRISHEKQCIFDNENANCYYYKGLATDSLDFIYQAKAFQQILVKDFLTK
jgi:phosphoglycerol transferase MdoB-like AlkP superfamily enzyme